MGLRVGEHIRGNVVGYVALFIALGGTAWGLTETRNVTIIRADDIADDAVRRQHINTNAVGSSQIDKGAVKASEIGAGAVGSGEIANDAVTNSKLANSAVTNPTIGAGAVGSGKIANTAVTNPKIADNAVTNSKIADGSVTGGKIGAGAVGSGHIAAGGVGSGNIADNAVTSGKIGAGAVGSGHIAAGGVGSGNIADNAVTSGKIAAGAVDTQNLNFDPATQSELDAHKSSADHDGRYFTEAELQTSDGSAPNTGVNRVHWDNLLGVPSGFADGTDATSGGGSGWLLSGNAGTDPATDFLGTTDSVALNLRVNNARGFRLEPASDGTNSSPNVIGGIADNAVTAGAFAATISGGGRLTPATPGSASEVTDDYGTIGGGANNTAGDNAGTVADARFATVGGGVSNRAMGAAATVAGGTNNDASVRASVGGGALNDATNDAATVSGGQSNTASGFQAAVGGGTSNIAGDIRATVGGGGLNNAGAASSTVGGGASNSATGIQSTVGGGDSNQATVQNATVGGGFSNDATGLQATVAGGNASLASGFAATVPGGELNTAAGDYSVASGRRATNSNAAHDGVFLFADSNNFDFASTAANEFAVRSTGGARFVSAIDGAGAPSAGVVLASGGGSWSSLSDRASKTAIEPVSGREVLDKLAELPVTTWSYEAQGSGIRHIGPMAQDFARAFGVGEDERHITSTDADGVALAAIKGLNERVEGLDGGSRASGLAIAPAVLAGIAALALILAAALGAALALRWSNRVGGRLAAS